MNKGAKFLDPHEIDYDLEFGEMETTDGVWLTNRVSSQRVEVKRASLRPRNFKEYIGQETVKNNLAFACEATKVRGDALDHVLLHGPPGLGKTSLAQLVADELGVGFKLTSGPVLERAGDLAAILTSLGERDILFIDEIHRLPRAVEEVLYPAMEDFQIDILVGQGAGAKSVRVPLNTFTLIGATTRTGLLTSPLRDRFGIVLRMDFYSSKELQAIVEQSATMIGIAIEGEAAYEIGRRSRGTPRIANRFLKRARDYAQVDEANSIEKQPLLITVKHAVSCLDALAIDQEGLDAMDTLILETVVNKFNGGPVGIDTLAAAIGEERTTLEDVYEPYLLQRGFLARTRRGRQATTATYNHLGMPYLFDS
jgi:Holliday junction DNA helicase RuvB